MNKYDNSHFGFYKAPNPRWEGDVLFAEQDKKEMIYLNLVFYNCCKNTSIFLINITIHQ